MFLLQMCSFYLVVTTYKLMNDTDFRRSDQYIAFFFFRVAVSAILNKESQVRMWTVLTANHWQKIDLHILDQCLEAVV